MTSLSLPRAKRVCEIVIRQGDGTGKWWLWADEDLVSLIKQMEGVLLVSHRSGPIYQLLLDIRYDPDYLFEQLVILAAHKDTLDLPN